jgi:hypothetical protein
MLDASRIVRHLRLRAGAEDAARRAARLLEDAMRTASLPDARGRIVLFRRVALGRIDPRAPPQTLALALERRVARTQAEIVYADCDAPHAAAVWFRDALDAHVRLALRLASGASLAAWYWPLAVRAWRPGMPIGEALRVIAFSLAALPEAPSALPRWVAALAEAGHAQLLVAALRSDDVTPLVEAAHLRMAVPAAATVARRPSGPVVLDMRRADTTAPDARRPGAFTGVPPRSPAARSSDARHELVRALQQAAKIVAGLPSASREPAPAHRATRAAQGGRALVDEPASEEGRAAAARAGRAGERAIDPVEAVAARSREHPRSRPTSRLANDPVQTALGSRAPPDPASGPAGPAGDTAPRAVPGRFERRQSSATLAFDGASTCAGGLLFLVPALARLRYAQWLDAHPEWAPFDVVQRVLALSLLRLRVPGEDPAWSLGVPRATRRLAPRRFVAPARWREGLLSGRGPTLWSAVEGVHALRDASGRLVLGAWCGACPRALLPLRRSATRVACHDEVDLVDLVANAWLVASRRWLRRHARIGLADLVLRPAAIAATPTHVDIALDLARADLRVRRAGLDLDPGWVPWLGRVVTFHYGRGPR